MINLSLKSVHDIIWQWTAFKLDGWICTFTYEVCVLYQIHLHVLGLFVSIIFMSSREIDSCVADNVQPYSSHTSLAISCRLTEYCYCFVRTPSQSQIFWECILCSGDVSGRAFVRRYRPYGVGHEGPPLLSPFSLAQSPVSWLSYPKWWYWADMDNSVESPCQSCLHPL